MKIKGIIILIYVLKIIYQKDNFLRKSNQTLTKD